MTRVPTMKDNPQRRHETTDVQTRPIWITGILIAACCLLVALAVTWMFNKLKRQNAEEDTLNAQNSFVALPPGAQDKFPAPRLQIAPEQDLAALREKATTELNNYGWIDKNAGIVRIPISRAMELIAQRGLPVRGQPGAPEPYRTVLDLQQARPLERETPSPTPVP